MLLVELYKTDIFNVKNINHFRWFNPKPLPGVSHSFWEKGNAKWPKVEFLPSQWNASLKCKVCFRRIKVVFLAWWVIIELRPPSTLCRDSSALLSIYVAAVLWLLITSLRMRVSESWPPSWELTSQDGGTPGSCYQVRIFSLLWADSGLCLALCNCCMVFYIM